jgi:hypothetical protein
MERIITPYSRIALLLEKMQNEYPTNNNFTSETRKDFENYLKDKQIHSNKKPAENKYIFTIDKFYTSQLSNDIIRKCIKFAVTYDYMQKIAYIYSEEEGFNNQAKQWENILDKKFNRLDGLIDIECVKFNKLKQNTKIEVKLDKQTKDYFDKRYKDKQKPIIEKILTLYIESLKLSKIKIETDITLLNQEIEFLAFINTEFGIVALLYLYEDSKNLLNELVELENIEDTIFNYLYKNNINRELYILTKKQRINIKYIVWLLKNIIKIIGNEKGLSDKIDTLSPTSQKIFNDIIK